jgi:hypothetical protein
LHENSYRFLQNKKGLNLLFWCAWTGCQPYKYSLICYCLVVISRNGYMIEISSVNVFPIKAMNPSCEAEAGWHIPGVTHPLMFTEEIIKLCEFIWVVKVNSLSNLWKMNSKLLNWQIASFPPPSLYHHTDRPVFSKCSYQTWCNYILFIVVVQLVYSRTSSLCHV